MPWYLLGRDATASPTQGGRNVERKGQRCRRKERGGKLMAIESICRRSEVSGLVN